MSQEAMAFSIFWSRQRWWTGELRSASKLQHVVVASRNNLRPANCMRLRTRKQTRKHTSTNTSLVHAIVMQKFAPTPTLTISIPSSKRRWRSGGFGRHIQWTLFTAAFFPPLNMFDVSVSLRFVVAAVWMRFAVFVTLNENHTHCPIALYACVLWSWSTWLVIGTWESN